MIFKKMLKNITSIIFLIILLLLPSFSLANDSNFNTWVYNFKIKAISKGISKEVVDDVMSKAIFLPRVIEFDRYQPEFYEDTRTYIKKRTSTKKIRQGLSLYKKEKLTIDKVEEKFFVEKSFVYI